MLKQARHATFGEILRSEGLDVVNFFLSYPELFLVVSLALSASTYVAINSVLEP